jgi:hypothetical protein
LNQQWDHASESERESIRQIVLEGNQFLQQRYRKDPDSSLLHEQFLNELARRHPESKLIHRLRRQEA